MVRFTFPTHPTDTMSRCVESVVPATATARFNRLIGTTDIRGQGTLHPLADVDPFVLFDEAAVSACMICASSKTWRLDWCKNVPMARCE